jgi:hypothetical protein
MDGKGETCLSCYFWETEGDTWDGVETGYCHRLPPTVVDDAGGPADHVMTYNYDWCGEWKADGTAPTK